MLVECTLDGVVVTVSTQPSRVGQGTVRLPGHRGTMVLPQIHRGQLRVPLGCSPHNGRVSTCFVKHLHQGPGGVAFWGSQRIQDPTSYVVLRSIMAGNVGLAVDASFLSFPFLPFLTLPCLSLSCLLSFFLSCSPTTLPWAKQSRGH